MRRFEERTSTRYPCVGEAKLQLAGTATEVWGKVLDISMTGCMVSLPAASTLEAGDDVELTLRIGPRSIRMRAWVVLEQQTARRVGLMFASMSAQARLAVNELVDELDVLHPSDDW